MDKRVLKTIIADQQSMGWQASFIERSFPEHLLSGNDIVVFSGIRRCGKSTLLHQIRKDQDEKDFYMNFDDDRLIQFSVEDFQMLLELFIELFGPQKTMYFDEIQNISGWERFVRRLYDYGYKVFITGSNATMLSRELVTHLSGRHISYTLFPFSFIEYLRFHGFDAGKLPFFSTENRALAQKYFSDYFIFGGFPAYINLKSPEYLKLLYESILYRDVMVRNKLGNEKEILELVFYLASNVSKLSSYNFLSKIIGVSNASTVKNYISYLQNSYLIFPVNKYDFSLKKQIQNPKKIYFIDNALIKTLGFFFTDDLGRILENLIFLELKRRNHEVFYHSSKTECNFLIRSGNSISEAIQVSYSLSENNTRLREINGLLDAMHAYDLNKAMIITNNEEENLSIDGKQISIVPAWKWLLEKY